MFFKLDLTIRGIYLDKDSVKIEYGEEHNITLTLRIPTEEEQSISHEKSNPFCTIAGEWQLKENTLAFFKSLANMKMPKGSKNTEEWSIYNIDPDGSIQKRIYIPYRLLPDPLVSYITQVKSVLLDHAKRTVNVLRWRSGTEGEHDPFSHRGSSWSFDGKSWLPLPGSFKGHPWTSPYIRTSEEILADMQTYIKKGKNHPVGHELYLEAWEQRHQNPRSALIVGIAAVETGLKQCISTLVPDAKWLIENTASPDVVKMLSEYLFLLPTINRVNKKVFTPKSVLNETLKKGVFMRNQIVHGKTTTITYQTLEEILLAVRDTLWILDYCTDYDWALQYVRPNTRTVLEENAL